MNSVEMAIENFFNQYRYSPSHYDFLEESDIFDAEEVLWFFFSSKRFTAQEVNEFLDECSKLMRIQVLLIFKLKQQGILTELESLHKKFRAKKLENLHRVHRKEAIAQKTTSKTSKNGQNKVTR